LGGFRFIFGGAGSGGVFILFIYLPDETRVA